MYTQTFVQCNYGVLTEYKLFFTHPLNMLFINLMNSKNIVFILRNYFLLYSYPMDVRDIQLLITDS